MWTRLWNAIREVIARMTGTKSIEQALHIMPIMSDKMEEAITLWNDMYKNEAEWLHEPTTGDPVKIVSLGLPSSISSEKARTATIDMKSVVTEPTQVVSDKDYQIREDIVPKTRAEYLNKMYQLHLLPHIRTQLEYGIAKGGLIIKPYVYNDTELRFSFCQADEFFPISFDSDGKMTEAAFTERVISKNICYTRLEYHKLDIKEKTVTVVNKAYKTLYHDNDSKDLGTEINLTDVEQWANIQPQTVINGVDRLLFAYFKMPEANIIDPQSPLGVSGFSKATKLIREADLQYSRMIWEYEGGQLAVNVDRDALKTTEVIINGKQELIEVPNILQGRLFRKVDLNDEKTYEVFSPNLRDTSYMAGLNNILMRIEDVTGLSRGTFSDITRSEAKTATELLIMRQRSFATNADIQRALQRALDDAIYVMNVFATLYELAPEGDYSVSYEWDDSLISSPEEELQRRLTLANAGIESRVNIRMWYYGETEDQAIAELQKVSEEALAQAKVQAISTGLINEANQPTGTPAKGNTPPKNKEPEDKPKKPAEQKE